MSFPFFFVCPPVPSFSTWVPPSSTLLPFVLFKQKKTPPFSSQLSSLLIPLVLPFYPVHSRIFFFFAWLPVHSANFKTPQLHGAQNWMACKILCSHAWGWLEGWYGSCSRAIFAFSKRREVKGYLAREILLYLCLKPFWIGTNQKECWHKSVDASTIIFLRYVQLNRCKWKASHN